MAKTEFLQYAWNRGVISPLGIARLDLKRYALSARIMVNWMCRTLGSMMLRPGLAFLDTTYNNAFAQHIPFLFSIPDTAIIELTDQLMRVRIKEIIISRVSVATTVANANPFVTGLTSWTSADDVGGTSSFSNPYLSLVGNGSARAVRYQNVTVASGDHGKEHALRIVIAKGYVTLRVGTSAGDDSYIANTILNPGIHSLAFTPTGNFTIQLSSATQYSSLVTSVAVEAAGPMTIPAQWVAADLYSVRWDQSADVLFVVANNNYKQKRIERRSTTSWSLVDYLADDGPFKLENIDTSITMTASALTGDITLTSNIPFFKSTHAGCLFRLTSTTGQEVKADVAGLAQWSNPVEVTGIQANGGRNLTINITGTWVGTVVLQYSVGAPGAWVDSGQTYTTNQTNTVYNDGFDNQEIFYRLGFEGTYTSGTAHVQLDFAVPNDIAGICRVDIFTDSQHVYAHVLVPMQGTTPTSQWSEGLWSAKSGYPTAVALYEGRLWQLGNDYISGSVSDAYSSYDDTVTGDSGPIVRTIAQGPVSVINWVIGLQRLLVGCDGAEQSVRSDSLDSLLTPTNFNIKSPSTRGSAAVAALKIDTNGIFVQRGDPDAGNLSGSRLIQIAYQGVYAIIDYTTNDMSEFAPEIVAAGITKIAVQRKIDTRIHCLLADGTVAILVYDPVENERAWMGCTTQGTVEDIFVMPGAIEDKVYYVVNRTINGVTKRYLEKWALESECTGLPMAKNIDSHIVYSGSATSTITGLSSLEGATVCVWGWNTAAPFTVTMPDGTTQTVGRDLGTFVVTSGQITGLPAQVTDAIVGLGYTAPWQGVKLITQVQQGNTMSDLKSIDHLGVILQNTHCQGLQYGSDFEHLQDMPGVEFGATLDPNTVWSSYDSESFEFDGTWDSDSNLCLQAASPRPCTILAANIGFTVNDK